jgi:cytochrome b pre-mRNA-processing protein 3
MFGLFSSKAKRKKIAAGIYQDCVARARDPVFYESLEVSDTLDGRFSMICLHVCLAVDRLYRCSHPRDDMGQAVFDVMFADMEDNLREHGIGDLSVPRHMKQMMQRYNGAQHAYSDALRSGGDESLRNVIARNIYGADKDEGVDCTILEEMCDYTRRSQYALIQQDDAAVENGHIHFAKLPSVAQQHSKDHP